MFERKEIMVEWYAQIEVLLRKYLRRQNGEYLIHCTKEFLTPIQSGNNINVVMMNKINPWTERFSHYIQMYNEVGMLEIWKVKHIDYYDEK